MKEVTTFKLGKDKLIIILLLLTSSIVQFYIKGFSGGAFVNILFQFAVSLLISFAASYILSSDSKLDQVKLWIYIYSTMIILTLLAYNIFPDFSGFNQSKADSL